MHANFANEMDFTSLCLECLWIRLHHLFSDCDASVCADIHRKGYVFATLMNEEWRTQDVVETAESVPDRSDTSQRQQGAEAAVRAA